ncbi:hypothetical protein BT96DRAFT_944825 [Gymnopus androsaceus JB14]|uniref:Uncharacterized protein n=1 Tax=Gymnopus androsaceus JB14 TaxID=1447944 RepID=A0A6A4H1Q6_9AGAR|nr:hypothetical protein BT96DRAFT_944825 [Gymnopus androsaceus JB14]
MERDQKWSDFLSIFFTTRASTPPDSRPVLATFDLRRTSPRPASRHRLWACYPTQPASEARALQEQVIARNSAKWRRHYSSIYTGKSITPILTATEMPCATGTPGATGGSGSGSTSGGGSGGVEPHARLCMNLDKSFGLAFRLPDYPYSCNRFLFATTISSATSAAEYVSTTLRGRSDSLEISPRTRAGLSTLKAHSGATVARVGVGGGAGGGVSCSVGAGARVSGSVGADASGSVGAGAGVSGSVGAGVGAGISADLGGSADISGHVSGGLGASGGVSGGVGASVGVSGGVDAVLGLAGDAGVGAGFRYLPSESLKPSKGHIQNSSYVQLNLYINEIDPNHNGYGRESTALNLGLAYTVDTKANGVNETHIIIFKPGGGCRAAADGIHRRRRFTCIYSDCKKT